MPGSSDSRELQTKTITRFRGLSQYRSIASVGMDEATDLLNVIVSSGGWLEKLRAPFARSAAVALGNQIDRLYDFQQGNGTRQLFATFAAALGFYTEAIPGADFVFTPIEASANDTPRFSLVDSNNVLYGANGKVTFAWGGAVKQNWGIAAPLVAPTIGAQAANFSVKRIANVVTVTVFIGNLPTNGFCQNQFSTIPVGSVVTVSGVAADPTANGTFKTTGAPGVGQFTYPSVGANFGPTQPDGFTIIPYSPCAATGTDFNINTVASLAGVVTIQPINLNFRILPGELVTVSGLTGAQAYINGTWKVATTALGGASFTINIGGPDFAAIVPGVGTVAGGFTNVISSRTWWYSYGSSGNNGFAPNESALSPQSGVLPQSIGLPANIRTYLTIPPPTDPQCDIIYLYGSLDGGGDPDLVMTITIAGALTDASGNIVVGDARDDSILDVTQRGSFINFPPPVCRSLSKWQNRIYFIPMSNQQSLGYTGYEQILRGRPEMNVPPGNFIQMNIGANIIKGHGPLMNGVVIWDSLDRMWMFKGAVEDITTSQPVGYSEQLEEMPWQIGVYSHESIQPTPYGVVWFGTDKTFHKWNGIFYGEIIGPTDIGQNLYPLLRRITPGTESSVQSAYFNFLERDWYVALIAVDGSLTPNRVLFFDMTKDASDNLGVWVSDIAADTICAQGDANGQKHLLISVAGVIYEIKSDGGSTGGLHLTQTETNVQLNAFWHSGYEGSDSPMMMKMYRYGRLITDQTGFNLVSTLVDDEQSTLIMPTNIRELPLKTGGKFSVNWKARRISLEIRFPAIDTDASVIQLSLCYIPLSER